MGRPKGFKQSEITRNKIGLSNSVSLKGHKHSEKTKQKIQSSLASKVWPIGKSRIGKKIPRTKDHNEKLSGKNHWNYKGGITPINAKIRNSLEYKLWRKAVFERDNYECIWGGKEHGSKLQADHIKPFSQYPELRFAIDNGRTLCEECHKTTDTFGSKAANNIYN